MTKAKILIIDDEDVIRKACRQALEKDGFEVDEANNGIIGLPKLHDSKYDLVLIDLKMSQISGMDVLEGVKKYDPDITCIVITGYGTDSVFDEAKAKGAFDILTKPFATQELRSMIYRAIEAKKFPQQFSPSQQF